MAKIRFFSIEGRIGRLSYFTYIAITTVLLIISYSVLPLIPIGNFKIVTTLTTIIYITILGLYLVPTFSKNCSYGRINKYRSKMISPG
jgi:uncharacterized membrane protein YhaH (DUF805 family)